ncbi:hypothetical protein [uncultured Lutibacter sp.]|uniref:hypothetical protein n=1 Tax=uncultured Lutibacter sp. TaxID=437739 RepID=UPI002637A425|nr:hypothetical protein [uncultured Lutibacter sp.]
MTQKKITVKKEILKIFIFILFLTSVHSCKVFQDPISLNEAANNTSEGYYKVTMDDGEEFIYEKIELSNDGNYIGFVIKDNKPTETILIKENIKSVQKQDKKSSGFSNILGFGVGVGSIVLGVLMFGS